MKHLFTRTASALLAFGIFFTISCATTEQTGTSEVPPSAEQDFDMQLLDIDRQIEENPASIDLRVQKADLLVDAAKKEPEPEQRKPYYQNLRDAAQSAFYQFGDETKELDEVLARAWSHEQSNGVRLLQQDESEMFDTHFNSIISHFENAITIIPDSLVTYSLKATTYYRHGNLNEAIQTLQTAQSVSAESKPELSEKLAYLHLESGNLDESVRLYRKLAENQPDDEYIMHGLANAYMLNNQHEEAADLLQSLADKYPSRHNYKEALATEIYFIFEKEADQLLLDQQSRDPGNQPVEQLVNMLEDIHSIFESLKTNIPANEENTFRMAAFYKNSSLKLREITDSLTADEEFREEIAELEKNHLEISLPLWERLADMNPDNMEYLTGLRNVYQNLGMEEEAESVERSINF
jgi:predicted Zn-dependent protease